MTRANVVKRGTYGPQNSRVRMAVGSYELITCCCRFAEECGGMKTHEDRSSTLQSHPDAPE